LTAAGTFLVPAEVHYARKPEEVMRCITNSGLKREDFAPETGALFPAYF
jgi:hypothetical protein